MDVEKQLDQWRAGQGKLEILLGLQYQSAFKLRPRLYTRSDFGDLYMDAKITKITFQCHRFHLQIQPESLVIIKRRQHPESVQCCVIVLAHWALYRVGVQ